MGWSSSSSEESPLYATRPVLSRFTTGSEKKKNWEQERRKAGNMFGKEGQGGEIAEQQQEFEMRQV